MHGDGFLRANAGLATAVLGGPTFPITECNKGNKGNNVSVFKLIMSLLLYYCIVHLYTVGHSLKFIKYREILTPM